MAKTDRKLMPVAALGLALIGAGIYGLTRKPKAPLGVSGILSRAIYWYEGLPGWVEIIEGEPTPEVPQGVNLHVGIGWSNTGEIDLQGHVALSIRKPDGSRIELYYVEGQDDTRGPGAGRVVLFEDVILDQPGIYEATAILTQTGLPAILDSLTFPLVHAVGEGVFPGMPPPEGWEWITEIREIEIRAAERLAATTGDTVLECLLVLYGRRPPPPPVARILSIEDGGVWVGEDDDYSSLNITWENNDPAYTGYWVIHSIYTDEFRAHVVRPTGHIPPDMPGRDYPRRQVDIGQHITQVAIIPNPRLQRGNRLRSNIYSILLSLSKEWGGVTMPLYRTRIHYLEQDVVIV